MLEYFQNNDMLYNFSNFEKGRNFIIVFGNDIIITLFHTTGIPNLYI